MKRITLIALVFMQFAVNAQADYIKRINCGYSGATTFTYNNVAFEPESTASGITYTGEIANDNLTFAGVGEPLKSFRYTQSASMSYEFTVSNGRYQVILYFVEPYHGPVGGTQGSTRVFDVDIENSQFTESNINVWSAGGSTSGGLYVINEEVDVTDGSLSIVFDEVGNDPIINAIEVLGVDNQPPSAPTLSSNAISENSVLLSWNGAADNVAVSEYRLFQDGVEISGIGSSTSFSVTGLAPSTSYNFSVTALDAAGNESNSSNTVSVTTSAESGSTIRINAGGPEVTYNGELYAADQYAQGGTAYANSNAQIDPLYQTERSGSANNFEYALPVTNGLYEVRLHFAEIYWGATGGGTGDVNKRLFDVTLEGTKGLDNYDIYAEAGAETPVIKTYHIGVYDGELNLYFSSLSADGGIDQAKLSALEVAPAGSGSGGLWTANGQDLYYNSGNVGIGTSTPDQKLAVNGKIHSKEVLVDLVGWPDYVFESSYKLPSLEEVEDHIRDKGHLPNVPSANTVHEEGAQLGAMNKVLLEKIEELTLYLIDLHKRNLALKRQIETSRE